MSLTIINRTLQSATGAVLDGATVTVRDMADNSVADIFSDRAGTTPASNPLTSTSTGAVSFFVHPGTYKLIAVGDGGEDEQIIDVPSRTSSPVYGSFAALAAAIIPDEIDTVSILYSGRLLNFRRDASGTAATSNGGTVDWSPAETPSNLHWGGTDEVALQAAIDWVEAEGGGDLHIYGTVECGDTVLWYPGVRLVFLDSARLKRPDLSPGYILLALGAEGAGWRAVDMVVDNNWSEQGSVAEPGSDPDSPLGTQHNPFALISASNSGDDSLQPNSSDIEIDGYKIENLGPYANGLKIFGFRGWSINRLRALDDGGGYSLWHKGAYVRRSALGRFHDWIVRNSGSHVARISGLGHGDQVDATGIMVDGCGRGVAIFDIGQVNIDCNIRNALWGAANGIAVVTSETKTLVTIRGVVDRCGQYGVNLTNVRDAVVAGLAVSNCGVAGVYGRNLRQAIFDNVQVSFRDLTDLRRPLSAGVYQVRWQGESHTLETAGNIVAAGFLFDSTGTSPQQIRIGAAIQVFNSTAATIYGLHIKCANGRIDIPDGWESQCVGVAKALEDPNGIARRPTEHTIGENYEVVRRPDGTQTTRWRIDMGAMGAAGAGTGTDLYRTSTYTANWPGSMPFLTWPTGLSLTAIARSSTAVERIVNAGLRRATESQLVQAQVAGLALASAGTANIGLVVEANGIWRWRTQQPVRHDFAAGRYLIDGAPVPFAPEDWRSGAVSHTRASAAWYIGDDGVIYEAAVDEACFDHGGGPLRENLAAYSDDLSNAWWSKNSTTVGGTYVVSDGREVGRFLTETGTTNTHNAARDSITISSGATVTISAEFFGLPGVEERRLTLSLSSTADASKWVAARFSAVEGGNIATDEEGSGFVLAGDEAVIESLGGGKYRASLTGIIGTATDLSVRLALGPVPADLVAEGAVDPGAETWTPNGRGMVSYAGDGSSGLVIRGIQIEIASSATRLIDTAGAAASVWGTRALRLEPSAVNRFQKSNVPSDAYWTKGGVTMGSAAAGPFDGINSDLIVEDSSTGSHRVYRTETITAGRTLVMLGAWKRGTGTRDVVLQVTDGTNSFTARFNGGTGALITSSAAGTGTVIAARCVAVALADGWWMACAVGTVGVASTTVTGQLFLQSSGTTVYTGDGSSSMYVAHLGLDDSGVGYMTSPIVTDASAVTRAADVATLAAVRGSLAIDLVHGDDSEESLGTVALDSTDMVAWAEPAAQYRIVEVTGRVAA